MLRRWVKPCPRCRGNHLIEMKEEALHLVKCMQCGYLLQSEEIRLLIDDVVLVKAAERDKAAA